MKHLQKIFLPIEQAERHIARIIRREGGGTVTRTSYTATLETEKRRYYFSGGQTSVKLFAALAKVRADIEQRRDAGQLWDEHADPRDVIYFHTPQPGEPLPSACWCVDISAAYPTTARNLGLISPETFAQVMDLDKPDRLKCLGMLASRKYVEEYDSEGPTGPGVTVDSPLRCWYFDLVGYVGQVMAEVRELIGNSCAPVWWVDGVFTTHPYRAKGALLREGYATKTDRIEGMRWSDCGRFIHYEKDGNPTYLCIPQKVRANGKAILDELKKLDR